MKNQTLSLTLIILLTQLSSFSLYAVKNSKDSSCKKRTTKKIFRSQENPAVLTERHEAIIVTKLLASKGLISTTAQKNAVYGKAIKHFRRQKIRQKTREKISSENLSELTNAFSQLDLGPSSSSTAAVSTPNQPQEDLGLFDPLGTELFFVDMHL